MRDLEQIFGTINLGLVVLDAQLTVQRWNRWMELHSAIPTSAIIGRPITDFYPSLTSTSFSRVIKSVFAFGNYAYFSQKLHKFLFPMKNPHTSIAQLANMQQHCTIGPIRNDQQQIEAIFITVQDVTEYVSYEHKLIRMAKTDALTGAYNRRYLDRRLAEEIDRSRRHGNPLSLMILDIDHFKDVNDSRGHVCGDYALRKLVELLSETIRSTDILGRYGGEEFCCILPETALQQTVVLAERCCKLVAASNFACSEAPFKLTISIGVTELTDGDNLDLLVKRADEALYLAKHRGRNRVVYNPPLPGYPT